MRDEKIHNKQQTVENAAARWAMRLASPDCSPAERAAFDAWCAQDRAHAAAFERTERSLAFVDRHRGYAELADMVTEVRAQTAPTPPFWRHKALAGAAMIFVVLLSTVLFLNPLSKQGGAPDEATFRAYDTVLGQRSTIMLADGSTVTLNTNSRIEVAYNAAERGIRLRRGQALFEVARDAAWPFVVRAGKQRITALGTAFDVKLAPESKGAGEEVQVALVEGRVAVDEFVADDAAAGSATIPENRIELVAGERLIASATRDRAAQKVDLEEIISWREGRLVFRDTPLGGAVAEINRYTTDQIRLSDDPRLWEIRVSGVFKTGQVAPFLAAQKATHAIDSQRTAHNEITLLWKE